jgi:hypothetical protein
LKVDDQSNQQKPLHRTLPRRVCLSKTLSPEEVSQAWQYLVNLPMPSLLDPEPELPPPPENLKDLSDGDWFLLSNLLAREQYLASQSLLQ